MFLNGLEASRMMEEAMRAIVYLTMVCGAATLSACAGNQVRKKDYSEIDVAVVPGCAKPSMQFDSLRDQESHAVTSDSLPVRVKPGVYSIELQCSWTRDAEGACVDTHGTPALMVPEYDLILNPKIRYVFSCDLEGPEYVIRMRESARN
jgi:hypothetical protein